MRSVIGHPLDDIEFGDHNFPQNVNWQPAWLTFFFTKNILKIQISTGHDSPTIKW